MNHSEFDIAYQTLLAQLDKTRRLYRMAEEEHKHIYFGSWVGLQEELSELVKLKPSSQEQ